MSKELFSKDVTLSNGDRVPLSIAVDVLGTLEGLLSTGDRENLDVVFRLRHGCLHGGPLADLCETTKTKLASLRYLQPDGSVCPEVRSVVLAAVQGEDRNLSITSPFTERWDRTVAELVKARSLVRLLLMPKEAELLISADDLGEANTVEELREIQSWADQVQAKEKPPGTLPPPPSRN